MKILVIAIYVCSNKKQYSSCDAKTVDKQSLNWTHNWKWHVDKSETGKWVRIAIKFLYNQNRIKGKMKYF